MTHSLRSCGKMSGWMLYMDAAISEGLPAKPQVLALSPLLKQIVSRIRDWVAEPKENAAKRRIVEVLRDEIAAASEVQLHLPMPKTLALKRLSARLADNSTTTKKLAALAREMGVSERSLFRKFQKETGLSHGQWRRQTQVLRSIELLADGRSVTEAALEVGYATTGAFIRTFRRVVGVTPTSYAQR
jgi:AraC-like DNA-binding protein